PKRPTRPRNWKPPTRDTTTDSRAAVRPLGCGRPLREAARLPPGPGPPAVRLAPRRPHQRLLQADRVPGLPAGEVAASRHLPPPPPPERFGPGARRPPVGV